MRFFCLFVVLLMVDNFFAAELNIKQEGATVTICNYKYVTECYAITRRLKRGEPYKTNLTAVTRHSWGNNVTLRVVIHSGITVEVVNTKLCECSKIKWLWDYLQTYSNINGDCPYKPESYGFYNMVFPPKNLPQTILNLAKGKVHAKFMFLITKTKEVIVEDSLIVYVL